MAQQQPPVEPNRITQQFFTIVQISPNSWFDRALVPVLLMLGVLFMASRLLAGDWLATVFSAVPLAILVALAAFRPLQLRLLGRPFDRNHAVYLTLFWVYAQLWLWLVRLLNTVEPTGKDSQLFYVFFLLFIAVTFRALLTLFAITGPGYAVFFSRIPTWEQVMVALNEFIAAGLLAYIGGSELARILQPDVFTLRPEPLYTGSLLLMFGAYYVIIQMMWVQTWNDWLAQNRVWVRLVRLISPVGVVIVSLVIVRHFTRLSDIRTADLLGTANLNQTILALSPIIWLMAFLLALMVYSGSRGLRQRLLPDELLDRLPERVGKILRTISDMDMLLLAMLMMTTIPVQLFVFNDGAQGVIDVLREQIAQQNAIIDSSEQALALIFALPFYLVAVGLLGLYAWVMASPKLGAKDRDALVEKLPIGLLIIFIIALYLCAIPFTQVLTEGRLPQLPQELGRLLAFDVLIPLILLYAHYYPLVRLPYGIGQSRWREQYSQQLEHDLRETDRQLESLEDKIKSAEYIWQNRRNWRANEEERFNMLFDLIDHNGERDRLNMARLRMVDERQRLAEISEAPVSLTIARLPTRIVSYGIPLLLAFKIYEWAVVNDGLREIANNPNIGVIEFFQTILEQTQF
ncbi:MAG: hypothetical protein CL607_04210 [Anaerolineaceae bacterium]|nr:hypothetical protein [Anaerolineaceae bacterium]